MNAHKRLSVKQIIKILPAESVHRFNYRLNSNGVNTVKRLRSDNRRTLLTRTGFQIYRSLVADDPNRRDITVGELISDDFLNLKKHLQETWKHTWNARNYVIPVVKMYNDVDKISDRSQFIANDYFKVLSEYGKNRNLKKPRYAEEKIYSILEKYKPWLSQITPDTIEECFNEWNWMGHIKIGTNSGYPYNTAQDESLALKAKVTSIKIFNVWCKDPNAVNWDKLAFMLGYRTERNLKQRVVAMASIYEKCISALINTYLDKTIDLFPIHLPRKSGSIDKLCEDIISKIGKDMLICTDFHAYDTSIPEWLLICVRNWLMTVGTLIAKILAFEVDLIIHGIIIIDKYLGYEMHSLESGIGVTQLIGSILHDIIDEFVELIMKFKTIQSDDELGITSLTAEECMDCFKQIKDVFGMDISPIGEKSSLSKSFGIVLQTIIMWSEYYGKWIFFGNEIRRWANLFYKERSFNIPNEIVELITGKKKQQGE